MSTTRSSLNVDGIESCVFCSEKYNRTRPSFCQCRHCHISLCLDCINEHHKELVNSFSQISHQYNELQRLVESKQMMIADETEKSIENINRYFDTYVEQLRDTQKKSIENMKAVEQNAQDHLHQIEADLRLVGDTIQNLADEDIVQMDMMTRVSTKLEELEEQLNTCQLTTTENVIHIQSDIPMKFDGSAIEKEISNSTDVKVDKAQQTDSEELPFTADLSNTLEQLLSIHTYPINQSRQDDLHQGASNSSSKHRNDNNTYSHNGYIYTSFKIHRMASDGKNILYASNPNEQSDRIAYCLVEDREGETDKYRNWNPSSIVDMIWWDRIGEFVCATERGIYTVDHSNRTFQMKCVIREKYSFVLVAANSRKLFVWMDSDDNDFNGIEVYSTQFKLLNQIDFDIKGIKSLVKNTASFCATNNLIASICKRTQNDQKVFQVTFWDLDMEKLSSVPLGTYNGDIQIRTDGNDRFFITTGYNRFYVVSRSGMKQQVNLRKNGIWIAVIDKQRVAVSSSNDRMEILTFRNK